MFYPTCFAWAKSPIGSDHSPIFLNTGEQGAARPKYFFFEEQWFQREGFLGMIQGKWDLFKNNHAYSLDRWHGCLTFLRRYLRGWNLQLLGDQKKDKIVLVNRIQELDTFAETRLLSIQEWEERIDI